MTYPEAMKSKVMNLLELNALFAIGNRLMQIGSRG